jgi:putative ABC transport system substrate-binding protein
MKDYGSSKNNFAFTSLNVLVDVQYSYLKELKPNVKNIAILVDSKNKSAIETQGMPIVELAKKNNVTTHWVAVENPAESKAELAKLIPDAVEAMRKNDPDLSNSVFWITGSTAVFREIRTINEFAGKVPVLSVVPEIVTKGDDTAALAIGISFKSNAQLAAVYADQILRGVAKAGDLKVGIVSPPDIAISFRKTHEIGMRVPFDFFENATFIYDYEGVAVRFIKDE